MTREIIEIALNAAFSLGQAYWRQADSDRPKDHDKADITLLAFRTLVTNTLTNIAQPDHPTAAMQIAGGAVLLDYINENEAESEKRVGALTAARVFIAMQKASN